ncbi:helix-turn-helix domain-containing protein [Paenibacillus thailandensis]|uniref:Helix-turn-helix domain-containing protein n=1 Tax=Paenibacillus thailandensis TaxID=393250 RepID=A0ABW5QYE3_9BACL
MLERQRLLRQTDKPVTDICFEFGFQSISSFSALLSQHIGQTPSQYRGKW